jgi:serpin B
MNTRVNLVVCFCAAGGLAALQAADFDAAAAANQVGIDLYRQLAADAPESNLALSPYSIESALALAYAGAAGQTRKEMARVLHFPPDDQPLQAAFASLRGSLDQIAEKSMDAMKRQGRFGGQMDAIEWHAANRLFGQKDYDFRSSFLGLLKDGYDAPFEPADFRNHAEQERQRINSWVEDQTGNRIRDLIPEHGLSAKTRLALVNALYLKAPWESHFEERATTELPFYPGGERVETVPTMRKTTALAYMKGNGFTAVALPYQGGDLQFIILLPDERDGLGRLAEKITPQLLRICGRGLPQRVALYLPKFRLEGSTIPLAGKLQALGMRTAFDIPAGSANFDRAAPRRPDDYLLISEVYHQAFIAVDEQGTEAAAATAVAMMFGAAARPNPPKPIEVRVDHPFFFAVQHFASGVCLFFGSVTDPH